MTPDELLLERVETRLSGSDDPRRSEPRVASAEQVEAHSAGAEVLRAHAAATPGEAPETTSMAPAPAEPAVPPVRTIVVDRAPLPIVPPQEREAVRAAHSSGPERLRLEDVSIGYGAKKAVKSVSLSIHQGEVLALIGPSGCGKTTLLRTLNRLTELTPSASRAGKVLLDGEDIHGMADTRLRSRVAMVFQQPNPFPMSIFDNVAFALREQSRKKPRRRELEPQVIEALKRAGLYEEVGDDLDRPALRLSGGQQQRLCIARALAVEPEVLLMDEPCSALDPISTGKIEELIFQLKEMYTIVIVTHNMQQAARVAEFTGFFLLGKLIEFDKTEKIFTKPSDKKTEDYITGRFG